MRIKIGQINAQRSAAAATNLENIMREKELDMLCLQEPFSHKGRVRGYNSPNLAKIEPHTSGRPWVAAVANRESTEVLLNVGDESEHVMCFRVIAGDLEFIVINVYCQHSEPIERFLGQMESLLSCFSAEKVLITMDANAKSEAWYSGTTDEKGTLVEEFMLGNNLTLLNRSNNPPTYMSASGQSNIDLTLVTPNLIKHVTDWKVDCSCTTSDHNLIVIELQGESKSNRIWNRTLGYNTKRANWQKFRELAIQKFDENTIGLLSTLPADQAVSVFNKTLESCCEAAIPKRKQANRMVPWWNEQLADLRKRATLAKKQLLRARRLQLDDLIEKYADTYRTLRNSYVSKIKRCKKETWQNFVQVEGNKDPWGIPYKIVREKFQKPSLWTALKLPNGQRTMSIGATIEALLEKCVPAANAGTRGDGDLILEQELRNYRNANTENQIKVEEINSAINAFKNNKAPGPDNFKIEVVKELWKIQPMVIQNLYNNCFRQEYFPKLWKESSLIVVPKDEQRDRTLLNSYRPIALLSVVGKIYEKIIVQRLQHAYQEQGLESPDQFGFRKGKGVDDAFIQLRRAVKHSDKKYVIVLFVDIEGAFDNIWWPAVLARIAKAKCSSHIINVIKSYFRHRKVTIECMSTRYTRKMQKGCPQGSIMGPAAWAWCMDALLNKMQEELSEFFVKTIAYADDLACVIGGDSRSSLETSANKVIEMINRWCNQHKLNISAPKTVAMIVKGKMDEYRLPRVKIHNSNIKYVEQHKYLGVIVDRRFTFVAHARYLRSKVTRLVMAIKRISAENWGIKVDMLKIIYGAVALPIVRYGSVLWFDATSKIMVKRNLLALQRALLLLVSRSCRTTSTAAMQVVVGVKPMHLEIVEEALLKRAKRNLSTTWDSYEHREKETEQHQRRLKEEIEKIKTYITGRWQAQWESEEHGRETYKYINDVTFVSNNKKWFKPNKETTYLITGYGPINSTLHRRRLVDSSTCPMCEESDETPEHIIFDCEAYAGVRYPEIESYRHERKSLIKDERALVKFNELAKDIFRIRRQRRTRESRGSASTWQGRATSEQDSDG